MYSLWISTCTISNFDSSSVCVCVCVCLCVLPCSERYSRCTAGCLFSIVFMSSVRICVSFLSFLSNVSCLVYESFLILLFLNRFSCLVYESFLICAFVCVFACRQSEHWKSLILGWPCFNSTLISSSVFSTGSPVEWVSSDARRCPRIALRTLPSSLECLGLRVV